MDLATARAELADAVRAQGHGLARDVLIRHGAEAFGIAIRPGLSLDAIVRAAGEAPASEPRRSFAILLVHAIGVPGLVPLRGEAGGQIRSFLERALLNPLRRAGYPFAGSAYDKNLSLSGWHATIEEHLRPPEPRSRRWRPSTMPAIVSERAWSEPQPHSKF